MSPAVRGPDGTGHEDHSVNQLGPGAGRHRLVEGVERGLVEPLALDERPGRGIHRGAFRHDRLISSCKRSSTSSIVIRIGPGRQGRPCGLSTTSTPGILPPVSEPGRSPHNNGHRHHSHRQTLSLVDRNLQSRATVRISESQGSRRLKGMTIPAGFGRATTGGKRDRMDRGPPAMIRSDCAFCCPSFDPKRRVQITLHESGRASLRRAEPRPGSDGASPSQDHERPFR